MTSNPEGLRVCQRPQDSSDTPSVKMTCVRQSSDGVSVTAGSATAPVSTAPLDRRRASILVVQGPGPRVLDRNDVVLAKPPPGPVTDESCRSARRPPGGNDFVNRIPCQCCELRCMGVPTPRTMILVPRTCVMNFSRYGAQDGAPGPLRAQSLSTFAAHACWALCRPQRWMADVIWLNCGFRGAPVQHFQWHLFSGPI